SRGVHLSSMPSRVPPPTKLDPAVPPMVACGKEPDPRRRSDRARRAILDAANALLDEQGFARASIEGIAQRAGVGKQTIYRWWPCRAAVLLEAYLARGDRQVTVPDTGELYADLAGYLASLFRVLTCPVAGETIA